MYYAIAAVSAFLVGAALGYGFRGLIAKRFQKAADYVKDHNK
jgi:hypothetical protein